MAYDPSIPRFVKEHHQKLSIQPSEQAVQVRESNVPHNNGNEDCGQSTTFLIPSYNFSQNINLEDLRPHQISNNGDLSSSLLSLQRLVPQHQQTHLDNFPLLQQLSPQSVTPNLPTNSFSLNNRASNVSQPQFKSDSSSTILPTATGGSTPNQCNVCKKIFPAPGRLTLHYRTHTGEQPFECEFCHKLFNVKGNLQVHRRIHTKERPYKCEICRERFEDRRKLYRHMEIHKGEHSHKCSICDKTFIKSIQLDIHMRTHNGEKPYKLPDEWRSKELTSSKQLIDHSDISFSYTSDYQILNSHKIQDFHSIQNCDETFKSKNEMEGHIKEHAYDDNDDCILVGQMSKFEEFLRQSPLPGLQQLQLQKQEDNYRRSIESPCYQTELSSIISPPSPTHQHLQQHIDPGSLSNKTGSFSNEAINCYPSNLSPSSRNYIYSTVFTTFE